MAWIQIRRMSVLIWVQIGSQRLSADDKKILLARKDWLSLRIKLLRANKIKIVSDQTAHRGTFFISSAKYLLIILMDQYRLSSGLFNLRNAAVGLNKIY